MSQRRPRESPGKKASWTATVPFNRHPPLGYVDWVGAAGYPLRATLHADGKWSATVLDLAVLFDAFRAPEDSVIFPFGLDVLRDLAEEVGGKLHLVHPDLALPRRRGHGDGEGDHVDG